ncbi:MAG: TauD/TfdA family dioxygenase [SAR86 cluster bacterium]|jgi:taurine dioxygenase|nr:TauD/TfdA family dioxygenase [SAR86 cluster bacterium]
MKINIIPSESNLGVEITEVDLTAELKKEEKLKIIDLWNKYSLVIFPDQVLSHNEFLKFSSIFGKYGDDPYIDSLEDNPHIVEVKRKAKEKAVQFGGTWHSDWSFQETPPSATILHSKIIPPVGGDTLFANTEKAYSELPSDIKEEIKNLMVFHSAKRPYATDGFYATEKENDRSMKILPAKTAENSFLHPMVRIHPITKKKCLFINPVYAISVKNMSDEESDQLLMKLYEHTLKDKYIFRHRWKQDMLIAWDNRTVMHQAEGGYDGYDRLLHRITISGDRPKN